MMIVYSHGCHWNRLKNPTVTKPLFSATNSMRLLLIILIVITPACSSVGNRPLPTRTAFNLPECIILRADPHQKESAVQTYQDALDAVALSWKIEPTSEIENIGARKRYPILILPMGTARSLTPQQIQTILRLVDNGAILVTEGLSPLSEKLGFRPGPTIPVRDLEEIAYSDVKISWRTEEQVTGLQGPDKTIVLNRERKSKTPMVCLLPRGHGHCLLLASTLSSGERENYARFPYFLQELQRAGVVFPFRSNRLSALFDYGYRYNENPEDLAIVWRKTGIQSLHVGAWDFYDRDPEKDAYLRKLIQACHRNGILVYAWLELPHVSSRFWKNHPEWREKTATGRDASVDWRLAMNLSDPQCFQAVAGGLEQLFRRFDWDGANLAELYFDSPAGKTIPENFTPLSAFVRNDFKKKAGIDPKDFFKKESPNFWSKNAAAWQAFVDYRVELERDLNERFIQMLYGFRKSFSPDLDIVVTYVDNIYDTTMREAVGADVRMMFELLDRYDFTLVMEDPGSVWHLGPRRYAELGQTYSKMTRHSGRLGIDINIVERYTESYPTQKQTGIEFLELFFHASAHFPTVMVYSEQTMLPQDTPLVACALAANTRGEIVDQGVRISSRIPVTYRSGLKQTDLQVDGNSWPCIDNGDVVLPAGSHVISTGDPVGSKQPHLLHINGDLLAARYAETRTIEFSYNARHRTMAIFDGAPKSLRIDNGPTATTQTPWAMLPRGTHKVLAAF